jgi:hypothetical protein
MAASNRLGSLARRWWREEEQLISCRSPILIKRFFIIWDPKIGETG